MFSNAHRSLLRGLLPQRKRMPHRCLNFEVRTAAWGTEVPQLPTWSMQDKLQWHYLHEDVLKHPDTSEIVCGAAPTARKAFFTSPVCATCLRASGLLALHLPLHPPRGFQAAAAQPPWLHLLLPPSGYQQARRCLVLRLRLQWLPSPPGAPRCWLRRPL